MKVATFLGSGNVGIGITNPDSPFTILGIGAASAANDVTLAKQWKTQQAIYATGAYALKLGAHYTNGVGAFSSIQSTEFYSGTEHPGHLVLQPLGGHVGIGITNPAQPLTVQSAGWGIVAQNSGATKVGFYSGGGSAYVGTLTNDNLNFCTNNSGPQMTVATNGNVGIGITNPTERLHVNGGIKATSGICSYNTSFFYASATSTWSPGDPTGWPWGGNTFLITFRGDAYNGGGSVRATFIVFHSRWGAGSNNYGQITALSNAYVGAWNATDGGMSFTFSAPGAQNVNINVLTLS